VVVGKNGKIKTLGSCPTLEAVIAELLEEGEGSSGE